MNCERRFYGANIWGRKKRDEKLNYVYNNPANSA
jgi:hypothetical protein